MHRKLKRMLLLLLTLAMILSVFPAEVFAEGSKRNTENTKDVYVYTEKDNQLLKDDVFAKINQVKEETAKKLGGTAKMTEKDFVRILPDVKKAVESSETYVKGTLQENGDMLIWKTTTGMPCCYSPRMEAKTAAAGKRSDGKQIAVPAKAEPMQTAASKAGYPDAFEVGLIQPYWDSEYSYQDSSFNSYSPKYVAAWKELNEATGGSCSYRYSLSNATVDNIAWTLQNCALVMIDSHGTTDYESYDGGNEDYTSRANSSYLCLTTNEGITSVDTASHEGEFGTYYDCIVGYDYAFVNGTCIANHMTEDAKHSMLYMGICLGMATDKMFRPLREKGVEVVYGYSQSVSFRGDTTYVQSIMGYLKDGKQVKTALAKTKETYGAWDPAYGAETAQEAAANTIAFPIVVSSEDKYPGHGKVDAVQTVNATWRLFNKEPEPCTITYSVNGIQIQTVGAETWKKCTLRATAPQVEGWKFEGWSTTDQSYASASKPTIYKAGSKFTPKGDTTFYAVYSQSTTREEGYDLVTEKPSSWAGSYVITFGSSTDEMYLMKGLTDDYSYESEENEGAVDYWSSGAYLNGSCLTNVQDAYVFKISASGDKYLIKNRETGTYLANDGYLHACSDKASDHDKWELSMDGENAVLYNDTSTSYPMIAFSTGHRFMTYSSTGGICLWKYNNGKQRVYNTLPMPWYGEPLAQPTFSITNVASSGKIKLTWKLVPGAAAYEVYRSTSRTGEYRLMKTTTNTAYLNTSAVAGKTYHYMIRAINSYEEGPFSEIKYRTCDLPRPVVKTSHVKSTGKNKLTWEPEKNAVKYEVYRAASKTSKYKLMKTTTKTSYVNTKAVAGKTYYYRVKAIAAKKAADSAYSKVKTLTCDLARPVVKATHVASTGKNKLTWKKITGAVSYKVYRATSKTGKYKLVKTTTKTSYVNTSAVAGKTYYYRVKAIASKKAANSAYSKVKTLTCDLARPVVKATHVASTGKNKLTWKKITGAVSYKVYLATSKTGKYKLVKTTTKTSYVNTAAVAGKTYYYKVKAIASKKSANSVYSKRKMLTCDLPRPVVKGSLSKAGKPKLTWRAVKGAVKYRVYRTTSKTGSYKLMKTTVNRSYVNSTAVKGKSYYYKVVAVAKKAAADSARSTRVTLRSK